MKKFYIIYKNLTYLCVLAMEKTNYKIKIEHFEGPFDLLLFFIERDELNIYDIPIHKLIIDFLDYIHHIEKMNIELSSEFILFVATLMRIKAKMLIPRKVVNDVGEEIDPRQELIENLLEYKKYKKIAFEINQLASERMLFVKRGNVSLELMEIGEKVAEGTEVNHISVFRLLKAMERIVKRAELKKNKHTVYRSMYTMPETRNQIIQHISSHKKLDFEKLFNVAENRLHAIFLFLNLLELIQQKLVKIMLGESVNSFLVEWNDTPIDDEFKEQLGTIKNT